MLELIRIFADDCVLYRVIKTTEDHECLQQDLNTLVEWTEQWQMILNPAKCVTLNCTRSLSPSVAAYIINNTALNSVKEHKYLRVMMNKSMSWSGHIQEIINKASKTLNFAKRILHQCTSSVKKTAYITLVRPILEYASTVWDPYQQYLINNIEMIQRQAARWVKQDYRLTSSVSDMINNLQWTTLQKRRMYSRLTNFYIKTRQISRSHSTIYITPYLTLPIYHTSSVSFHLLHQLITTRRASSLILLQIGITY